MSGTDGWQALLAKRAATEAPYVMQVGRYLFFAVCSLGVDVIAYGLSLEAGFNKTAASQIAMAAFLVSFVALRDMSKSWDLARKAVSEATEASDDQ
jgi:hypothetical protein